MSEKLPLNLSNQLVLPVINAPMFLVSSPDMVIESCKNGIVGTFPLLNARTTELLENWMIRISEELTQAQQTDPSAKIAPWGVNVIVHRTNKRFEDDMELIKKYEPPIVITSLGNPSDVTKIVHAYGGLVFSDVISLDHARKAAKTGIDGLILVCSGAGGHGGTLNPFAFLKAVKEFWEGITVLAGAISTGEEILAAKILGADLVYMGTRFIATEESSASEAYRQMLIESTLEDLIYTDAISGIKGNYLLPSLQKAGIDIEQLNKKEVDLSFSESKAKAWKDIWSAGQGVGNIKKVSTVKEIVEELTKEYKQALTSKEDFSMNK
ncbi:NAD(P)H-dependent flavin oxidoreductase [Fictibacillus phosphorivorans]|uniref:NAD(P)H-dependent flavin oxidoreductase n=1 Tax=Fictibacillus phosphorivorans TaxID=1221500 RepID=UPI00203C7F76|nr:nitronate monooxygenase [Fictibacillus phosphorivorans]MCM3717649.1 nitronate monooxygenase [Fictibacillus phosphorivorans]MCM3775549.1 nitronate monooxygenase [Fictibacillus phosphorivorans]